MNGMVLFPLNKTDVHKPKNPVRVMKTGHKSCDTINDEPNIII